MSGTALSALSAASSLALSDLFYVVQTPGAGGKKATLAQLETLLASSFLPLAGTAADSSKLGGTAAASYLLSATAASTYLSLTGGALSGALRVHGSTNTVAVGSTTTPASNAALSFFDGYPSISISSDGDYSGGVISYVAHPTNANVAGGMFAMKSRGTTGAPSAVQSGDNLGAFEVDAWAGDVPQFIVAGDIRVLASENWDDTHWGSHLLVRLNPPGSSNLTEVLRLDGSGALSLVGNLTAPQLALTGDVSAAAWTTNGLKLKGGGSTLTDTSSSGTVALQVTDKLGGNTIAASSATTYTNYASLYLDVPTAGSNVTITNPWSLYATGAARVVGLTSAGTATITPAANTNALAVTGYSLTGSNAQSLVDLAGTWNTSGTPTAIKLNVTDTASNASSLLMDLQVGGTSKFKITKAGQTVAIAGTASAPGLIFSDDNNTGFYKSTGNIIDISIDGLQAHRFSANGYFFVTSAGALNLSSAGSLTWGNGTAGSDTRDLTLYRDAAGILAQRNSTNAQEFKLYASYTDASNWEAIRYVSYGTQRDGGSGPRIAYSAAGTGTNNRNFELDVGNANIQFSLNGARRLLWDYQKNYPDTTASYDFGNTTKRFQSLYLGQSLTGSQTTGAIDISTTWNTSGTPSLINIAVTDTASNAASMLIKATVGAATVFGVDKAGKPTFGTHSALAAETVTGYITIVDAGGTTRKLAVVS